MAKNNVHVALVLLLAMLSGCLAADELKGTVIFVGTGARSPFQPFSPLDKRVPWPRGFGQQTPAGARQLYLLGRYMRKLYIEDYPLLSRSLNVSELLVRSAMTDRNILAAQTFALGLYPDTAPRLTEAQAGKGDLWAPPFQVSFPNYVKSDLNTSSTPYDIPAVPLVSYNGSCEQLLSFAGCPRYVQAWKEYFASDTFTKLLTKYWTLLTRLCNVFDIDCSRMRVGDNLFHFADYLLAGEFEGRITEIADPLLLGNLTEMYFEMRRDFVKSKDWLRTVHMHNFSETIPAHFDRIIQNATGAAKMWVLSADELTVLSYLLSMETKELPRKVPFGSFVQMDLVKLSAKWAFNVSVSLNGETVVPSTNYDDFKKKLRSWGNLTLSWENLCGLDH